MSVNFEHLSEEQQAAPNISTMVGTIGGLLRGATQKGETIVEIIEESKRWGYIF
jgi:hypothetical protein